MMASVDFCYCLMMFTPTQLKGCLPRQEPDIMHVMECTRALQHLQIRKQAEAEAGPGYRAKGYQS